MNRKLFIISFIAIFLIASVSLVSAADSQDISVKVNWDDANKADNRPNEIIVNLMKDNQVVDTAKLSESNSWKTIFKVSEDGDYSVKVDGLSDYSTSINGDNDTSFTITNTLILNLSAL